MAQPPQSQYQTPDPTSPDYQQQVAASLQALVSGRRQRDPAMSGVSTGRLILEGVVESFKIYRGHKQDRAQGLKKKEEENQRTGERKSRRRHGDDRSHAQDEPRRREHRGGSRREASRDGNGERRRRRVRHRSADDREGHDRRKARHRSSNKNEREHRRRHRSGPRERSVVRDDRDRRQLDQSQQRRSPSKRRDKPGPPIAQPVMSGALRAVEDIAEKLLGPDGTPFGSLPIRGKGVGFLAHATIMYRHIKAEQDAGHRSTGFAEHHVGRILEKRRRGKSALDGTSEETELLIEKTNRSGGSREGRRQRRYKAGSDEGEESSIGASQSVYKPVDGAEPSQARGMVQQPTRSAQHPSRSVPSASRNSLHDDHQASASFFEREELGAAQSSRGTPSVPDRYRGTHDSGGSPREPNPLIQGGSSVRGVGVMGVSRTADCHPLINVQSPTPPKQAGSAHSHARSTQVTASRVPSRGLDFRGSAISVGNPVSAQLHASLPVMATSSLLLASHPATPSTIDVSVPDVPTASPVPPGSPLQIPSGVWPNFDPIREALLSSIELGVKLKKVSDGDRKDTSAVRIDEPYVENVTGHTPVYEETPHSHKVEAWEHVQAVEEFERRGEGEQTDRARATLIAPQPQPTVYSNVQDELAGKLAWIHLNKQKNGAPEARLDEPENVLSPRASSETWRTVCSDNEQYSEPDRVFKERLGNMLSAGTTTETIHEQIPARKIIPAPDVFVNLSANNAGPKWGFDSVPKEGSD